MNSSPEFSVGFFLVFPVLWSAVLGVLHLVAGWNQLQSHYSTRSWKPLSQKLFCSGMVGYHVVFSVNFSHCLDVGVDSSALYLRPWMPFRLVSRQIAIPFALAEGRIERVFFYEVYVISPLDTPKIKIRVSKRLGHWIEEEAMRLRGG